MKFNSGRMIKVKTIVITNGETKSSSNRNAAIQITKCKNTPSNLLMNSLLYGFTVTCIKASITQTAMST